MAFIPRAAFQALILAHPRIGTALWIDTLIDGSIFREWVVNVGRRDARSRIAHLLCEFARRLEVAGLQAEYRYELPMTQEQLADAVGLTPVHVNRILQTLSREGLIERSKRFIAIPIGRRCAGSPASPKPIFISIRPGRRSRRPPERLQIRKNDQPRSSKKACANRNLRERMRA